MQYVSCTLITNSPHAGDARFAVCMRDHKTFDSMHHCTWLQWFIYYLRKSHILNSKCLLPSIKPCEWREGIEIILHGDKLIIHRICHEVEIFTVDQAQIL